MTQSQANSAHTNMRGAMAGNLMLMWMAQDERSTITDTDYAAMMAIVGIAEIAASSAPLADSGRIAPQGATQAEVTGPRKAGLHAVAAALAERREQAHGESVTEAAIERADAADKTTAESRATPFPPQDKAA